MARAMHFANALSNSVWDFSIQLQTVVDIFLSNSDYAFAMNEVEMQINRKKHLFIRLGFIFFMMGCF